MLREFQNKSLGLVLLYFNFLSAVDEKHRRPRAEPQLLCVDFISPGGGAVCVGVLINWKLRCSFSRPFFPPAAVREVWSSERDEDHRERQESAVRKSELF